MPMDGVDDDLHYLFTTNVVDACLRAVTEGMQLSVELDLAMSSLAI
jgi:hypothetical protein